MKVSEIMSKNVLVCHPEDSLYHAAALMWDNDIGALPVVDDQIRTIGMITDRDICMSAYTKGQTLENLTVRGAMSRDVYFCTPNDTLATAEQIMIRKKIHRLPVVDGPGLPVGILTLNDMARHAGEKKDQDLDPEQVVKVFSLVAEPRARAWESHKNQPAPL